MYESRLGTHVAYQVKYRQKGYLTYTEVAPFLGITERFTERVSSRLPANWLTMRSIVGGCGWYVAMIFVRWNQTILRESKHG